MRRYILGIITIIFAIPILESLTELLQVAIEIPKGVLSRRVIKLNKDLQELQENEETASTDCIGFEIPANEYDDEE